MGTALCLWADLCLPPLQLKLHCSCEPSKQQGWHLAPVCLLLLQAKLALKVEKQQETQERLMRSLYATPQDRSSVMFDIQQLEDQRRNAQEAERQVQANDRLRVLLGLRGLSCCAKAPHMKRGVAHLSESPLSRPDSTSALPCPPDAGSAWQRGRRPTSVQATMPRIAMRCVPACRRAESCRGARNCTLLA